MAVSVRFVLTGACHPYSGRQVLFALPLESQGSSVTIGDAKSIIRRCWPSTDLPLVASSIQSIGLKILKNGKLLSDDQVLHAVLTQQEIQESATQAHTFGSGFDDNSQSVARTVLMHLVFHSAPAPSHPVAVSKPLNTTTSVLQDDVRRTSHSDDTGCGCCVM